MGNAVSSPVENSMQNEEEKNESMELDSNLEELQNSTGKRKRKRTEAPRRSKRLQMQKNKINDEPACSTSATLDNRLFDSSTNEANISTLDMPRHEEGITPSSPIPANEFSNAEDDSDAEILGAMNVSVEGSREALTSHLTAEQTTSNEDSTLTYHQTLIIDRNRNEEVDQQTNTESRTLTRQSYFTRIYNRLNNIFRRRNEIPTTPAVPAVANPDQRVLHITSIGQVFPRAVAVALVSRYYSISGDSDRPMYIYAMANPTSPADGESDGEVVTREWRVFICPFSPSLHAIHEELLRILRHVNYEDLFRELFANTNPAISKAELNERAPVHEYNLESDGSASCGICLESFEDSESVRKLPCIHIFHAECLDPWLTQYHNSCPYCRNKVVTP